VRSGQCLFRNNTGCKLEFINCGVVHGTTTKFNGDHDLINPKNMQKDHSYIFYVDNWGVFNLGAEAYWIYKDEKGDSIKISIDVPYFSSTNHFTVT